MEDSNSRRRSFTVGLKSAHEFVGGLIMMSRIRSSSAVLIVNNGEVQISVISSDLEAYGMLPMEASTAASWTSNSFAIPFNPSLWAFLLMSSVHNVSLWIYKIATCPHLYCLLGNDSNPIKLGKAHFVKEDGIDLKNIDKHHVKVHLRTKCLRDVIFTFSSRYDHVMMMAMNNRVSWVTASGELTHSAETGDCLIEGVEPGTASYMLMQWRNPRSLSSVSWISEDVVMCTLTDPKLKDWILFSFVVDEENSMLYMIRAADTIIAN